jgi:hypothetical protein
LYICPVKFKPVTALEKQIGMSKKWYFYSSIALIVALISSGFKPFEIEKMNWFYVDHAIEGLNYTVPTQEELQYVNLNIPQTGKTFTGFKQALSFKESQGRYNLVNTLGYMGKYQFGVGTLRTLGITDSAAFMNSPHLQEKAFKALLAINKHVLKNEIEKYKGKTINGVIITESGLLAAAHLGGSGSVKKFLKSNGKRALKDGYGTSLKSYIKQFGGYDTSHIVANGKAKVK